MSAIEVFQCLNSNPFASELKMVTSGGKLESAAQALNPMLLPSGQNMATDKTVMAGVPLAC